MKKTYQRLQGSALVIAKMYEAYNLPHGKYFRRLETRLQIEIDLLSALIEDEIV